MKIKDLKLGMPNVDIVVEIDFTGEKGGRGYGESVFLPAIVKDETGEIKMTFWDSDVRKVKPGKKVKITKGYVSEYNGQLQLNANRKIALEFI